MNRLAPPVALTIAGTDSGGAAGVAADLTTFAALGVHGACVVTAVTAQDTTAVHDVHPVPTAMVGAQLDAVVGDLPVAAVKTGMLGSPEVVALLAELLPGLPGRPSVVVDPVLVATSGAMLGGQAVVEAYRELLLPRIQVLTPNPDEARALTGADPGVPVPVLAERLADAGPAVIVTGGPEVSGLEGSWPDAAPCCIDWLALPGVRPVALRHLRVPTENDHGTGCTFSAALAARLAHGDDVRRAAERASAFTRDRLAHSAHWRLGAGRGPVAHVAHAAGTEQTYRPSPSTHEGESA